MNVGAIFIAGMIFGAFVMFMARLADKQITKIVNRYEDTGSVIAKAEEPKIVPPPKEDPDDKLYKEFLKQTEKTYGKV